MKAFMEVVTKGRSASVSAARLFAPRSSFLIVLMSTKKKSCCKYDERRRPPGAHASDADGACEDRAA
jgi:hypothetical protein